MDSNIARIRREKWLQHQQQNQLSSNNNDNDENDNPAIASIKNNDKKKLKGSNQKSASSSFSADAAASSNVIDLLDSDDDDDTKSSKQNDACFIDLTTNPSPKNLKANAATRNFDLAVGARKRVSTTQLQLKVKSSAEEEEERTISSFSICTWNVWFGNAHSQTRMSRIVQRIAEAGYPTFVGLQEVTPELLSYLKPLLQEIGYQVTCQEGVAYGCALGVRTTTKNNAKAATIVSCGFEPYRHSIMSRGLLWVIAKLDIDGVVGTILFGTTHLESYIPGNDGSNNRKLQMEQVHDFCTNKQQQQREHAVLPVQGIIITGDLNWDDERKKSTGSDPNLLSVVNSASSNENWQWQDAWLQTRPGQDGYTYDSKENPMLRGHLRRRFDRCLVYTSSKKFGIHSTDLIGKDEIKGFTWKKEVQDWKTKKTSYQIRPLAPSDHFGLVVTMGDASKIPQMVAVAAPATKKRKYQKRK